MISIRDDRPIYDTDMLSRYYDTNIFQKPYTSVWENRQVVELPPLPRLLTKEEVNAEQDNVSYQHLSAQARVALKAGYQREVILNAFEQVFPKNREALDQTGPKFKGPINHLTGGLDIFNKFNKALQRAHWKYLQKQGIRFPVDPFNRHYAPGTPIAENIQPNPRRENLPPILNPKELENVYDPAQGEKSFVEAARKAGYPDAIILDVYDEHGSYCDPSRVKNLDEGHLQRNGKGAKELALSFSFQLAQAYKNYYFEIVGLPLNFYLSKGEWTPTPA